MELDNTNEEINEIYRRTDEERRLKTKTKKNDM